MNAARYFRRYFSPKQLRNIYREKIRYKATVGMDRITPQAFETALENNIQLISRKVLSGKYRFTRYREVLISKGRGKEPRVISIPTIRDKLALAACHRFLQDTYGSQIQTPLLHTIVSDISKAVLSGEYTGFVKIDITRFYSSIDHQILLKKLKRKVRKPEAIYFIQEAIATETIAQNGSAQERKPNTCGVPEGLSISNILADIFLTGLEAKVTQCFDVRFYRYVDDILILCDASMSESIKNHCINLLQSDYSLKVNENKTMAGSIAKGVPFLGYVFYDENIGIRDAAVKKLEASLEDLFRLCKKGAISTPVFTWRLKLKIAGCILDSKKYGWLCYYSQLTDQRILFHLDWLIDQLFDRFDLYRPEDMKRFVRTYYEITRNVSNSKYLINVDRYTIEDKIHVLSDIYRQKGFDINDAVNIDFLFKKTMFKEIQKLENDIQNFS